MIELTQHISKLLLESDLAIIPGFGGFIAHYKPAIRDAKNNLFIPPALTVGFNDQLVLNDGLLLQSYMAVNKIGKSEAELLISQDVDKLRSVLEENGCVELDGIGILYCDANNKYSFKAENNVLDCPLFYGLNSFEMLEVAELMAEVTKDEVLMDSNISQQKAATAGYAPVRETSFSYFGAVAVIALAIVSMFMFTSPIENTEVVDVNYAKIIPTDIWEQFSQKSITTTPILKEEIATSAGTVVEDPVAAKASEQVTTYSRVTPSSQEVLAEKVKSSEATEAPVVVASTEAKPFHIIVASAIQNKHAVDLVASLHRAGYAEAQVLKGNGHTRVSIACFATSDEAYRELRTISQNSQYESAWVYQAN